ncbi:tetratricopeptide repeat protein [Rhizobium sp.]
MKHFFRKDHSYVVTLADAVEEQGGEIVHDEHSADVVWYGYTGAFLQPEGHVAVHIFHGGQHFDLALRTLAQMQPTTRPVFIMCKYAYEAEWLQACFPFVRAVCFLGKYARERDRFRKHAGIFEFPLVFLNNNNANSAEILQSIDLVEEKYPGKLHCFGAGTTNGFRPDHDVLPRARFTAFLKPGGYICNSVTRSICSGVPVIMKRSLWEKEYRERYPAELFILSDDILSGIEIALELDDVDYDNLSNLNYYFGQCSALKYLEEERQALSAFVKSFDETAGVLEEAQPAHKGLAQFVASGDIHGLKNAAREAFTAKRHPLSIILYGKVLDLRPSDEWAYFDLAHALFRSGKIGQAFDLLEQGAFSSSYPCLLLKADFLKGLSRFEEALAILEELMDQDKDRDVWATYHHLNICRLLGRQVTTDRLLRAESRYGTDPRVRQELAMLQR